MISSESINNSKYSIINEQNFNISNDLEINDPNSDIQEKENKNIQSIIIPTDDENNEKGNDKLLPPSEKNNEKPTNDLYGNKIENINPKFLGNSLALFYNENGDPRITIGPDCKNILLNFYIRYA